MGIKYTNENKNLLLTYPATTTIFEIKQAMTLLLKIPYCKQQWKGWPLIPMLNGSCYDIKKLSEIGIESVHKLELTKLEKCSSEQADIAGEAAETSREFNKYKRKLFLNFNQFS